MIYMNYARELQNMHKYVVLRLCETAIYRFMDM